MRLVGDVHGKYKQYKDLVRGHPGSIQVGDMGLGFRRVEGFRCGEFTQNPPHAFMKAENHRFIRGNHDNPGECEKNSQWIKDGSIDNGIMFIGGAESIDKAFRVKDFTWWEDEELSQKAFDLAMHAYLRNKPHAMITHECPQEVANHLFGRIENKLKWNQLQHTRKNFQEMFAKHQPKLWVFGHWHTSFDTVINGTRFVCLAELEARDDLL